MGRLTDNVLALQEALRGAVGVARSGESGTRRGESQAGTLGVAGAEEAIEDQTDAIKTGNERNLRFLGDLVQLQGETLAFLKREGATRSQNRAGRGRDRERDRNRVGTGRDQSVIDTVGSRHTNRVGTGAIIPRGGL